jgi:hypothetical protein
LVECLQKFVADHQEKRAAVTEEQIDEFMRVRPLQVNNL